MHTVDVVRRGSQVLDMPEVGVLYTHLVMDALTGRATSPGVDAYARIMGVKSRRTVSRALDVLDSWGVVTRTGSRRTPKYALSPGPDETFCRDVVEGMFGTEVLESVWNGSRRAELCETSSPDEAVGVYAMASLLAYYGEVGLYPTLLPEPSEHTNTGYVVFPTSPVAQGSQGEMFLGQTSTHSDSGSSAENLLSRKCLRCSELQNDVFNSSSESFGTSINNYTLKRVYVKTDLCFCICLYLSQKIFYCPPVVPVGFELPPIVTRSAQTAKKRRDTLPDTSSGFVYWAKGDLVKDTDHYDTITDLVEYGNELFNLGEVLNWQLYIRVRTCLVENALPPDQIRKAFKAASLDPFWKDKASVGLLCKDPNRVRELSRKSTHDRLARSMSAIRDPNAPDEAYEF
jgi:hypothetical protein